MKFGLYFGYKTREVYGLVAKTEYQIKRTKPFNEKNHLSFKEVVHLAQRVDLY
jgi:hypothetical protein